MGQRQAVAQLEQLDVLHLGLLQEREREQLQHGVEREADRRDCADVFAAAAARATELQGIVSVERTARVAADEAR